MIQFAEERIDQLRLSDCIDATVPRRAALTLLAVLAVVGTICYSQQESALLAGKRLLAPWLDQSWPRWNTLSFAAPPQRVAAGDDFEVELIDLRGRLPDEVVIQYWIAGETQDPSRRAADAAAR